MYLKDCSSVQQTTCGFTVYGDPPNTWDDLLSGHSRTQCAAAHTALFGFPWRLLAWDTQTSAVIHGGAHSGECLLSTTAQAKASLSSEASFLFPVFKKQGSRHLPLREINTNSRFPDAPSNSSKARHTYRPDCSRLRGISHSTLLSLGTTTGDTHTHTRLHPTVVDRKPRGLTGGRQRGHRTLRSKTSCPGRLYANSSGNVISPPPHVHIYYIK